MYEGVMGIIRDLRLVVVFVCGTYFFIVFAMLYCTSTFLGSVSLPIQAYDLILVPGMQETATCPNRDT